MEQEKNIKRTVSMPKSHDEFIIRTGRSHSKVHQNAIKDLMGKEG